MQQVHFGVVLFGNARSALHRTFGERGKIGGCNDTVETGHGSLPGNERHELLIIVIPSRVQLDITRYRHPLASNGREFAFAGDGPCRHAARLRIVERIKPNDLASRAGNPPAGDCLSQ
jgi:hypothetical protein